MADRIHRGFTLIELVLVLVLVAMLAGVGSTLVGYIAQHYSLTRQQTERARDVNLAMGRLLHEARRATNIVVNGSSVTFTDENGTEFVFEFGPDAVRLNSTDLIPDATASFTWSESDRLISFLIQPAGTGFSFSNRVYIPLTP